MEIHVDEMLKLLGQKEVEIYLLQQKVAALVAELDRAQKAKVSSQAS